MAKREDRWQRAAAEARTMRSNPTVGAGAYYPTERLGGAPLRGDGYFDTSIFAEFNVEGAAPGMTWVVFCIFLFIIIVVFAFPIWFVPWFSTNTDHDEYTSIGLLRCDFGTVEAGGSGDGCALSPTPGASLVDPALFDPGVPVCQSMYGHACGLWKGAPAAGIVERVADAAHVKARAATTDAANALSVARGEVHDFAAACVAALSDETDMSDDRALAREMCERIGDRDGGIGHAMTYGVETALSLRVVERPNNKLYLAWGVGAGLRQMIRTFSADPALSKRFFATGCESLDILGMLGEHSSYTACAEALLPIYNRLALAAAASDEARPTFDFTFVMHLDDVLLPPNNASQLMRAVTEIYAETFEGYSQILADADRRAPPVRSLPHLTFEQPLMRVVEHEATVEPELWLTYLRVSFLVDGMRYTPAVLNDGSLAARAVRRDLGNMNRVPAWVAERPLTSRERRRAMRRFSEESNAETVVFHQLWSDCAWLAAQHLPSAVQARQLERGAAANSAEAAAVAVAQRVAKALSDDRALATGGVGVAHEINVVVNPRRVAASTGLGAEAGMWRRALTLRQRAMILGDDADARDMHFDALSQTLTLRGAVLEEPYFSADVSLPSQYGRLGALIGAELARGLVPGNSTCSSWAADVAGLRAALRALQSAVAAEKPRVLRDDELAEFVEVYSQTWCTTSTGGAAARADYALRHLVDSTGRHSLTRLASCKATREGMRPEAACSPW